MALVPEKLAASLEYLHQLQQDGIAAIPSRKLPRIHRERLLAGGYLSEVMKGWYIPVVPGESAGNTSTWYSAFWPFCRDYLEARFGTDWCLGPEQSLLLHTGDRTVPAQLLVRSPKAGNKVTGLLANTSLLDLRANIPPENQRTIMDGMRVFSLPSALVHSAPTLFRKHPVEARAALAMLADSSDLLEILLVGGHSSIAGRLAGGLRNIGREATADEIVETMGAGGYRVREQDPFSSPRPGKLKLSTASPEVSRLRLMWAEMRPVVMDSFPPAPGLPRGRKKYVRQVEDLYTTDAYNSLSIEGYQVTTGLIERVRSGNWSPDTNASDRERRNALAARGYWQAFRAVEDSLSRVLQKANAGEVARADHRTWYRELFAPSVVAGIIAASELAGYRTGQVFIRGSKHVPASREAVRNLMPALFDLLTKENEPAVRAVLGHFAFVYIHPYMDGNGRIGRFLMNLMLASGGYPWTVIPLDRRTEYMAALEGASVNRNIESFSSFLAGLIPEPQT